MNKKVSISYIPTKQTLPFIEELISELRKCSCTIFLEENPLLSGTLFEQYAVERETFINSPDLVIVLGGDGTFLKAARDFAGTNTGLFGINRGRLGFLTEFSPEEYLSFLPMALEGSLPLSRRMVMKGSLLKEDGTTKESHFINDAVISKGSLSRSIRLSFSINEEEVTTYYGDGVIVSTPTGSTAYSLSAGGPIVTPETPVYLMTPVCPHTLGIRPMILDSSAILEAKVLSGEDNLLLTIDGQEGIAIEENDKIRFTVTDLKVTLFRHPHKNYHSILREKLSWG